MSNITITNCLRVLLTMACLSLGITASLANACSFMETKTVIAEDGIEEAVHTDQDYAIWGRVSGERAVGKSRLKKSASAKNNRIVKVGSSEDDSVAVTALEVEVLRSDTPKARSGDRVYFYLINVVDTSCETRAYAFDKKQYPVGSAIRVVNQGHAIPQWEVQKRFRLVNKLGTKPPVH